MCFGKCVHKGARRRPPGRFKRFSLPEPRIAPRGVRISVRSKLISTHDKLSQADPKSLFPCPPVTKHLHFGLKSSLYLYVARRGTDDAHRKNNRVRQASSAPICAPGLRSAGQDAKVMARECGGFRVKRCKTGQKSPGFWPRKPVAKRFSGLT